jgi:hypothetical protein
MVVLSDQMACRGSCTLNELGCQNHLSLVLTGEQGRFKTIWLDNICPLSLKSYLFTGKIKVTVYS